MLTGDHGGDDERQDKQFEHPHQQVSGEGDEHDGVPGWLYRPQREAQDRPQHHSHHRQHQQQVGSAP